MAIRLQFMRRCAALLCILVGTGVSAFGAESNVCKPHFGLEVEFAYVGRIDGPFLDDASTNFEPPLTHVLEEVSKAVCEFNRWPVDDNRRERFTKSTSGVDYPQISVSWRDNEGREWKASQESVGGRLYDGLEVITPKLDNSEEAAAVVDHLYKVKELAKGPFSGLHIWVDTSCIVDSSNSIALAKLLVDYEDLWSPMLKTHFQLSQEQETQRNRFWKKYSSCNPRLLQSIRALLSSGTSSVPLSELRELFVKYTQEELACSRLASVPAPATRAASRFWRYKELNVASPLNLAEHSRNAVEFRAWDFMSGNQLKRAIQATLDIVQATATPERKQSVVNALTEPALGSPVKKLWREVDIEHMLFHRNLQDPKFDPKNPPTSSPTAPLSCSEITSEVTDDEDRGRLCLASESCDYDGVAKKCFEITSCDDYNEFKNSRKERKSRCENSRLVNCIFQPVARICSVPFPTSSPTTPSPTQSPAISTCEENNDKKFASKSVREAGCTADKGCVWSGASKNGECYAVSSCADYNQFKTGGQARKSLCIADTELNCVYDRFAKECVDNEIPENVSSCGAVNEYTAVDVDVREDACVSLGECVWSNATKDGECFKVDSCEDINQFSTRKQGRKNLCLESKDFSCTYSSSTKSCFTPFVPSSTTTCAEINDATGIKNSERKSLCTANDDCEWSGNQKTCFEVSSCEDYNQFTPKAQRRNKCRNSERFSCDFSQDMCSAAARRLRQDRSLQDVPSAAPVTLEITPGLPDTPTMTPTLSPTMAPTSSPEVSTCEQNNDKKFGSREQRQAGCSKEKGCVWSDSTKNGECYTVNECDDFNQFKNKDSARKTLCTESEEFSCEFKAGACSIPSPTASPTTPAPTMSPVESTCEDNNKPGFASKAIRRLGCSEEKGCVWSDATNKGECYSVSTCADFDQFKNKEGSRKTLCESSTSLECLFVKGQCRDAVSPAEVACLLLNKPSTGTKAERKVLCEEEGCVWSSAGSGECYTVETCSDYDQFSNVNGQRRILCRKDPMNCVFEKGECKAPVPTVSPTMPAPTASPVESTCEENDVSNSAAPRGIRKEGCTTDKGCVWSSAGGGECHTVEECVDFNQFKKGNGKRKALCLDSDMNCAFSAGECYELAPTNAPTASPVAS